MQDSTLSEMTDLVLHFWSQICKNGSKNKEKYSDLGNAGGGKVAAVASRWRGGLVALELVLVVAGLVDDRCAAAWCAAAARARILLPLPPSLLPPGRPGPSSTGGLTWPPPASNSPRWAVSDRPPQSAHAEAAEEEGSHLVGGLSRFLVHNNNKWVRDSIRHMNQEEGR